MPADLRFTQPQQPQMLPLPSDYPKTSSPSSFEGPFSKLLIDASELLLGAFRITKPLLQSRLLASLPRLVSIPGSNLRPTLPPSSLLTLN